MTSRSHGKPSPRRSDANAREMRPNVISGGFRVHVWREVMVISFSFMNLSLVVASQTQVGKMSSEINSVMPALVCENLRS